MSDHFQPLRRSSTRCARADTLDTAALAAFAERPITPDTHGLLSRASRRPCDEVESFCDGDIAAVVYVWGVTAADRSALSALRAGERLRAESKIRARIRRVEFSDNGARLDQAEFLLGEFDIAGLALAIAERTAFRGELDESLPSWAKKALSLQGSGRGVSVWIEPYEQPRIGREVVEFADAAFRSGPVSE